MPSPVVAPTVALVETGSPGPQHRLSYAPPDDPRPRQPEPRNDYAGPLSVVCVLRRSSDYTAVSVERLRESVQIHLSRPHDFVCLTDEPRENLSPQVRVVRLRHPEWQTKQSKLELFRPDLNLGRALYLDLDTLVVGSLDGPASYSGDFMMLGDLEGKPQRHRGSGIMALGPGFGVKMYWAFVGLPAHERATRYPPRGGRGDQAFINEHAPVVPHALQDFWPGCTASYKVHCAGHAAPPAGVIFVCFHGRPKMRETRESWVPRY